MSLRDEIKRWDNVELFYDFHAAEAKRLGLSEAAYIEQLLLTEQIVAEILKEEQNMPAPRTVNSQDYSQFKVDFYKSGKSHYLRLGQAFINQFFPLDNGDRVVDRDPTLYYENDDAVSESLIFERYVK